MKNYFIALFSVLSSLVLAQNNFTTRAEVETNKADYMLIPFDPSYYMSDMDVEIGEYNKLKSIEIRSFFREKLDEKLFVTIKNKKQIKSMMMTGGNNTIKDLSYIIESIKYEYAVVEPEKKETKIQVKKPSGQLDKKPDTQAKYMRAACANKKAYDELFEINQSNYIISVNQFEIKNSFNDQLDLHHNTHKRKINVHYNILDKNGKTVYGGIASSEFANNVVDINEIVKLNFEKLATEISAHLPIN